MLKNWPLSEQENPLADYTPELHDNKGLKRLKNNNKGFSWKTTKARQKVSRNHFFITVNWIWLLQYRSKIIATLDNHIWHNQVSKVPVLITANSYAHVHKISQNRGWLYDGFQSGLKFQLVKPWWGFISYKKWKQCKNRIMLICKCFITVNRAEISTGFAQTELKFSSHLTSWK